MSIEGMDPTAWLVTLIHAAAMRIRLMDSSETIRIMPACANIHAHTHT